MTIWLADQDLRDLYAEIKDHSYGDYVRPRQETILQRLDTRLARASDAVAALRQVLAAYDAALYDGPGALPVAFDRAIGDARVAVPPC